MKYKILRYCTSFALALSMVGTVPALALADSVTVPVSVNENEACYTLTLTSGVSTQTAGYTETTQAGPTTALLPSSYSIGALAAATLTETVIPPWVDPTVDVNLNGTNTPVWISTHSSWPGGTANTEGSSSLDQWRLFQENFTLPAAAVISSANLSYAVDNAADVYLNGNVTPLSSTNDTYGAVPGGLPQNFGTVFTAPFVPIAGSNSLDFVVRNWGGDATLNPTGLLYKAVVNYCMPITDTVAVDLLSAGDFGILSKTGITNTGSHTSVITGNIGSSPITASAMDTVFCSEITGTIYGIDAAYVGSGSQTCFAGNPPLSNKTLVDMGVLDMGTAYADAAGRTNPIATELGAGNIGGMTLAPGVYKWSTDVTIPTNVTLSGGADDVWIFQISGNLDVASGGSVPEGIKVLLSGDAQASNIFWQVGGLTGATLGTYSTFNGTILSAKQIIIQTGAVLNGRALAQTQVTLDGSTVSAPAVALDMPETVTVTIDKYIDGVQATALTASSSSFGMSATWDAENIGAGTGTFALTPTGFNSANPYEAVTADMTSGASYSTNEIVDGTTVGATCASGTPFALTGYSVGDTLAAAASNTPTLTAPAFTGITSDKYVIVHNRACVEESVMPKVHILKNLDGNTASAVSASSYLFPMTATWMTANLNGGATSSGAYVLGNNYGGAADLYGADTVAMQAPAYYTTSEITSNLDVTSNVAPIDGTCVAGNYRLLGYKSSSISFSDAATQTLSTLAPEFTGLASDRYVIVENESCPATGSLTIQKVTIGDYGTFNFTGNHGVGPFTLTTSSTTNTTSSTTFTNLTPGTYHITEVPQRGWIQSDNECASITITAGESNICVVTNTKNVRLGEIRGTKYEDKKGNGKFPGWGYPRLSGWTIYLDTNNNGTLDGGESSTLTDTHGNYRFTELPAGTYYVRELLESGWIQTYPSAGMYTVLLKTGKISKSNDFGNFHLGSISGMKYDDVNANGRKNSGEGGLSGWTIVLKQASGATATTTTNGSGNYSFSNLGPGTYKLSEVMQTGWRQTDHPSQVTIRSGTVSNNDDFGNTQKPPRWRGERDDRGRDN